MSKRRTAEPCLKTRKQKGLEMRRKRTCPVLIGAALSLWSASADAATTGEWRRDVDAIVNDVLAYHPAPFAEVGELVWRREAAEFRDELPALSEPERVIRLMQLVAMIGDGHSAIQLTDERYAFWYPIRLLEFSDGYFVTSAHKSENDLAGAQLLTVAGRPAAEAVAAARTLFGADNEFDVKLRLFAVHNAYLMQALGFTRADGSMETTFRLRNGSMVKRILKPQPADGLRLAKGGPIFDWTYAAEVYGMPFGPREDWVAAYQNLPSSAFREVDETRPPFLQLRTRYTRRALPEADAYYVQMNQTDDTGMVAFMGEALAEVDRLKPKRLIIDMRNNFGGDGSTVTPMIHQFIRRGKEKPWKELYLLTGPKTFSAGLMAVEAFAQHTDVTIVGEPLGAAYNSSGDAISRPYPALGLALNISTNRHQLAPSNDFRDFIPVDVPAPMAFADYIAGRDPAVDPILSGEEMRSIPAIARADGGAAARRAHLSREARFAALSWYRPPSEIALRFVVFDLVAEKRFEDAVETAKLTTEIHPYIWNSWYNLADAQNAAGQKEASYSSYQCVVLLEPNNWNVPTIRELFKRENVSPTPAPGCPVGENS